MTILFMLIPLSIIFLLVIIWAFFWAVKNGQFDNLEMHGLSILDREKRKFKPRDKVDKKSKLREENIDSC